MAGLLLRNWKKVTIVWVKIIRQGFILILLKKLPLQHPKKDPSCPRYQPTCEVPTVHAGCRGLHVGRMLAKSIWIAVESRAPCLGYTVFAEQGDPVPILPQANQILNPKP